MDGPPEEMVVGEGVESQNSPPRTPLMEPQITSEEPQKLNSFESILLKIQPKLDEMKNMTKNLFEDSSALNHLSVLDQNEKELQESILKLQQLITRNANKNKKEVAFVEPTQQQQASDETQHPTQTQHQPKAAIAKLNVIPVEQEENQPSHKKKAPKNIDTDFNTLNLGFLYGPTVFERGTPHFYTSPRGTRSLVIDHHQILSSPKSIPQQHRSTTPRERPKSPDVSSSHESEDIQNTEELLKYIEDADRIRDEITKKRKEEEQLVGRMKEIQTRLLPKESDNKPKTPRARKTEFMLNAIEKKLFDLSEKLRSGTQILDGDKTPKMSAFSPRTPRPTPSNANNNNNIETSRKALQGNQTPPPPSTQTNNNYTSPLPSARKKHSAPNQTTPPNTGRVASSGNDSKMNTARATAPFSTPRVVEMTPRIFLNQVLPVVNKPPKKSVEEIEELKKKDRQRVKATIEEIKRRKAVMQQKVSERIKEKDEIEKRLKHLQEMYEKERDMRKLRSQSLPKERGTLSNPGSLHSSTFSVASSSLNRFRTPDERTKSRTQSSLSLTATIPKQDEFISEVIEDSLTAAPKDINSFILPEEQEELKQEFMKKLKIVKIPTQNPNNEDELTADENEIVETIQEDEEKEKMSNKKLEKKVSIPPNTPNYLKHTASFNIKTSDKQNSPLQSFMKRSTTPTKPKNLKNPTKTPTKPVISSSSSKKTPISVKKSTIKAPEKKTPVTTTKKHVKNTPDPEITENGDDSWKEIVESMKNQLKTDQIKKQATRDKILNKKSPEKPKKSTPSPKKEEEITTNDFFNNEKDKNALMSLLFAASSSNSQIEDSSSIIDEDLTEEERKYLQETEEERLQKEKEREEQERVSREEEEFKRFLIEEEIRETQRKLIYEQKISEINHRIEQNILAKRAPKRPIRIRFTLQNANEISSRICVSVSYHKIKLNLHEELNQGKIVASLIEVDKKPEIIKIEEIVEEEEPKIVEPVKKLTKAEEKKKAEDEKKRIAEEEKKKKEDEKKRIELEKKAKIDDEKRKKEEEKKRIEDEKKKKEDDKKRAEEEKKAKIEEEKRKKEEEKKRAEEEKKRLAEEKKNKGKK